MSYSAQVQEQYFRTVRIQVVEDKAHRDWYVVQRDVVAGAIVAVLSRYDRRTGAREWKPLGYLGGARLYKGEALNLAKAEAIALSLPFDPKRDLVNIKDVEQGPVQKCVACGQDAGRGRQPVVCQDCLNAIAAGKAALQTTAEGLIEAEDLLTYNAGDSGGDRDNASMELAKLLAKMAGARIGNRYTYHSRKDVPFIVGNPANRGSFGDKTVYSINLALDVAVAMQQIVDWFNARLDQAYIKGHQAGASVLLGLAAGRTSIDDLAEIEVRRGKLAQVAQTKLDAIAAGDADVVAHYR